MAHYHDDHDWGNQDRPWSARHPLAHRLLQVGATVLAARTVGPSLLNATEGMVRRELSSSIGPGRRAGHLYKSFRALGILDRLPGIEWDAAGRAVPHALEIEQLATHRNTQQGDLAEGRLGQLHNTVVRAHGVRYLIGQFTGDNMPATDEMMRSFAPEHLTALRHLVQAASSTGELQLTGDWWQDPKWAALRDLHAKTGNNPNNFAQQIQRWIGSWRVEQGRAAGIIGQIGQQTGRGFDPWFQQAVRRIQDQRSYASGLLGMQEAAATEENFQQLAVKEEARLNEQRARNSGTGRIPNVWTPDPIPTRAQRLGEFGSQDWVAQMRMDKHIYDGGDRGLLDVRATASVAHGLWNEVKNGFQLPIIPYIKGIHPLQSGAFANIGRNAALTGKFQLGQIHPTVAMLAPDGSTIRGTRTSALIDPMSFVGDQLGRMAPVYSGSDRQLSGMSFEAMDGNFARITAGGKMARLLGEISGQHQKRDNWLGTLPGPLGKYFGKLGNMLDLGAQTEASYLERQTSRVSKFGDPRYPGNLTQRIWSDPLANAMDDAMAKKKAVTAAFLKAGSLDDHDSPIYKTLHALTGQLVAGGGLDDVKQLQVVHNAFNKSKVIRETRSERLGFLLSQSFDEIRDSRRLNQFRHAVAEEVMLRRFFDKPDTMQRNVLEVLGRGTVNGNPASADQLLTNYADKLPNNRDARAWMTGALLSAVDDRNAEPLLNVLRDSQQGVTVREQVQDHVYRRAFPTTASWTPPQESPFPGTAFIAIRQGPQLVPTIGSQIRDTAANWNEHLHQLAAGRHNLENVITATVGSQSPFARMAGINHHLATLGLGLSSESMTSGFGIFKNLALKRILPVAALTFYGGYVSWEARRLLYGRQADEDGQAPGPLANLRARFGIGINWFKDITGINSIEKKLIDYVPGTDNYFTPRNAAEYKQYLKSGYDPVRQGALGLTGLSRLNFFNDTPIYGGKITRWQPSWYARASADEGFSKSGLTRDEFYAHSWLPTPRHPLSTINRLLHPYFWEDLHEKDRPYPVSGKLFAGSEQYFGPLGYLARPLETIGNAVFGPLLKPRRILDRVYDDLASANERIKNRATMGGYDGAPTYIHKLLGEAATASWRMRSSAQKFLGNAVTGGVSPYPGQNTVGGGSGGGTTGVGTGSGDSAEGDAPQGGLLRMSPLGKRTLFQTTTPQLYDQMAAVNRRIHGKANIERFGALDSYRRPRELNAWENQGVEPGPGIGEQAEEVVSALKYLTGATSVVNRLARGESMAHAQLASADLGYGGHAARGVEPVNPIRNRQPDWMPGDEGYTNFKEGDPYSKVAEGESRLAGPGYEKLHRVKIMETRASSLGKSKEEIMAGMLSEEQHSSKAGEAAMTEGTAIHRRLQKRWVNSGIAESVEGTLYDEKLGISGHLDAILKLPEGRTVVDIKTVNDRRYQQSLKKPFEDHLEQVNWYLHQTHINRGEIMYLNRDHPEQTHVVDFDYSQSRYNKVIRKVEGARDELHGMLRNGTIARGDLYSPLDRFKILADTAPYAEQTKAYAHRLSKELEPDTPEWEQFQGAKKRLQEQKQSYQLYPYRFGHADNVDRHSVTVAKVLDANTFSTKEDPEHPIRFAGISVSQSIVGRTKVNKGIGGRLHSMGVEAKRQFLGNDYGGPGRWFNKLGYVDDPAKNSRSREAKARMGRSMLAEPFSKIGKVLWAGISKPGTRELSYQEALGSIGIKPGAHLDLISDRGYKMDTLSTERSIVYRHGQNLNRTLLNKGWAKEKRDPNSPAQLHLFYSAHQRWLGRIGELIAHADTPFNDKLLKARSPLEEYERGQLYGKTGGNAQHPWRDKVVPTTHRLWNQHPLAAAVTGAAIAGAFWKTPGLAFKDDKVRQAIMGTGALVGFVGSAINKATHDADHPWIPGHRKKEWQLQEYFDTLDYVKTKTQANRYKNIAYDREGVDVDQLLRGMRMRAVGNKRDKKALEIEKSHLMRKGTDRADEKIKKINSTLNDIANGDMLQGLTPYAARAVAYEHAAEKTMYGMPAWATIGDRLAAIPRAHRQIISEVMEHGSDKEKRRLVRELPSPEVRVIGRQLDPTYVPERRANLVEYFQQHFLPRQSWAGWEEEQSLQPAQAKEIKRLGLDPMDAGPMFHSQYQSGLRHPLTVGPFDKGGVNSAAATRNALYDMLGPHADGLDIQVSSRRGRGGGTAQIDLKHDRDQDYSNYLNRH